MNTNNLNTPSENYLPELERNDRDPGPCLLPARSLDFLPVSLPSGLTAENRAVLEAVREKRVGELSKEGISNLVRHVMGKAKVRLAHKGKDEAEEFQQAVQIIGDLRMYFYGLTAGEVHLAVDRGLNGKYKNRPEEVVYFSPSAVFQWLEAYVGETKPAAFQQLALLDKPEEVIRTEREGMEITGEGLLRHYERLREEGNYQFEDYGSAYFHLLEKLGLLQTSVGEKFRIYAEEESKVIRETKEAAEDKTKRFALREALKGWVAELQEKSHGVGEDNPLKLEVVKRCRMRSLREYLEECVNYEVNLPGKLREAIAKYEPPEK